MTRPDPSFETGPLPLPLQATLQQPGCLAMTPIHGRLQMGCWSGRDPLACRRGKPSLWKPAEGRYWRTAQQAVQGLAGHGI
jgi:hypothetical protein